MFDLFMEAFRSGDIQAIVTSQIGQLLISFLAVVILILAVRKNKSIDSKISTKVLVTSAMLMALAFVLSNFKVYKLPQGGSITPFRMLMVVLIGYLYGTRAGVLGAVAYGFLELVADPSVVTPIQLIIDYPLAFGALGLSGLFSNSRHGLVKGMIVGSMGRFICHFISGYIFFGQYAPEGWNPAIYSMWYNFSYIGVECIITVIVLMLPGVAKLFDRVKSTAIA